MVKLFLIAIASFGACLAASCVKSQLSPIVFESLPSPTPQLKVTELSETQAIEFAERFISLNGYTDSPPDKENLAYESIEWESDVNEMLKMRRGLWRAKPLGFHPAESAIRLGGQLYSNIETLRAKTDAL